MNILKNLRILACNDKIMEIIGPNVRILDISWYYYLDKKYKSTITDKGFSYLKKIHTLNMISCSQKTITDLAFKNFLNLHTLDMPCCDQITITDLAFTNLLKIVNYNF